MKWLAAADRSDFSQIRASFGVRRDGYQFTGGQASGFLPIDLVMSDRSPILPDFFSPAAVMVPRRRLRIMITVHSEVQVVPM